MIRSIKIRTALSKPPRASMRLWIQMIYNEKNKLGYKITRPCAVLRHRSMGEKWLKQACTDRSVRGRGVYCASLMALGFIAMTGPSIICISNKLFKR